MKSIGLSYQLASCNEEPDGVVVDVEINAVGKFEAIFVDGHDLTDATSQQLMRALISQRNIIKAQEKIISAPVVDDLEAAKSAAELEMEFANERTS